MSSEKDIDKIHADAKPQFAPGKTTSDNNGVASAKPTVITGSDDATANKLPPGTKKPEKDWDINYDERDSNEGDSGANGSDDPLMPQFTVGNFRCHDEFK